MAAVVEPGTVVNTATAAAVAGVTERQVNHWVASGYVVPHYRGAGSGDRHRFSLSDVRVLWAIGALSDAGLAVSRIPAGALRSALDAGLGPVLVNEHGVTSLDSSSHLLGCVAWVIDLSCAPQ